MNRKEFFEKISEVVPKKDLPKIQQAYWLAKNAHRGQKRESGERYFEHCRRVAIRQQRAKAIIIALLHDCVEDCFIPRDLIKKIFGDYVSNGVNILSKVKPASFDDRTGQIKKVRISDKEYFQNVAAASTAIRLIKLGDRLDNVSTLNKRLRYKQQEYIAETEKYILPIAKKTDKELHRLLSEEIAKIKKKGGE